MGKFCAAAIMASVWHVSSGPMMAETLRFHKAITARTPEKGRNENQFVVQNKNIK